MALNLSRQMYSGRFVGDGSPDRGGDGCAKPWHCIRDVEDSFEYHPDIGGSKEAVNDILDVLPADPFGMDISTTFTAITEWLGDMDYCGSNEAAPSNEEYELFARFSVIWNSLKFLSVPVNIGVGDVSFMAGRFDVDTMNKKSSYTSCNYAAANCSVDDIIHKLPSDNIFHQTQDETDNVFLQSQDDTDNDFYQTQDDLSVSGGCSDRECSSPHQALTFALSYLGVQDLLSTEGVCRFLRSTIKTDPLLWRNIRIDQPLNEKINDDVLIQLTGRAQGNLQTLILVECLRITDYGLKLVLESNPRLTKLCITGCTRLSIDGIITNLKAFSSSDTKGIQCLRIGGIYGVTQKHFDELKLLLSSGNNLQHDSQKRHFYGRDAYYLPCDDDRSIDIEACPLCQNPRLVYDCPNEGCQGRETSQTCRACTFCIQRCIVCGQCIKDGIFVENFFMEYLCADCWNQLPTEEHHENIISSDALSEHDALGEPSSSFSTD
uniref:F-box protein SKIP14 n=1 Tax=Kalanchoe fedtschenkoi TaxID=63787 RepID=A0A7N1A9K0_KALFE